MKKTLSLASLVVFRMLCAAAGAAEFRNDVGQVPGGFFSTSTTLKVDPATAAAGSKITLTSKTTGVNWSGVSVSFYLDGNLIGTAPTDCNSQAQFIYSLGSLAAGPHTLQATFPATRRGHSEVLIRREVAQGNIFGETRRDVYITTGTVVDNASSSSGTASLTLLAGPTVSAPTLLQPRLHGSNIILSFASEKLRSYAVEFKDSLSTANWQTVAALTGTGDVLSFTNAVSPSPSGFYRLNVK